MKRVAVLGSTGSIGKNTLEIARHLPEEFKIVALAANRNIDLLEEQIREFRPKLVAVFDEEAAKELRQRVDHVEIVCGMEGLKAVASYGEADFVMSAISGTLGLEPTLAAVKAGKRVGLANKEALVSGGALLMGEAAVRGLEILPVDSEHSAIFQCLTGENRPEVSRIILTASGGPFRTWEKERLLSVGPEQALKHPNWSMGAKVTIDSSTLMNKGLEMIEAKWLFDLPCEKISVVVHPQSVIHSMVEFIDGSLIAQMGEPDMKTPIQYAMTHPKRKRGMLGTFDFLKYSQLEFSMPDMNKFPCLSIAIEAMKLGKSYSCYMNGANEVLVNRFLRHEFMWHEIAERLQRLMERHSGVEVNTLDAIVEVDACARRQAAEI
jgi:1-deoxy-D-xylulose-5-phosphate reductoisomerase